MFSRVSTLSGANRAPRRYIQNVVIASAVRTPVGSFNGSLSSLKASQLGSVAIKGALEKANVAPADVDEVLMGNVLSAGMGQAPARQALHGAGIPWSVPATTVNKVCASGMKTVMMAAQSIATGMSKVSIAGGMESMSKVPYYMDQRSRTGLRLGDAKIVDGLVSDGLWDVYNDFHMGNCAEHCARTHNFTREEQDEFAIESYKKTAAAVESGAFKNEIVPVEVPQRRGDPKIVAVDEEYTQVDYNRIPSLRPVFQKDGTVTAANASTINDGASALVVMHADEAASRGLGPLAKVIGFADAATEPIDFTIAPALAIPKALERAGLSVSDIDFWEINEAFSVVVLANIKLLNLDPAKVNVNGGGVSLGHPIGASGARIITTLAHQLQATGKRYGCAAICNGGGGASAIVIENPNYK